MPNGVQKCRKRKINTTMAENPKQKKKEKRVVIGVRNVQECLMHPSTLQGRRRPWAGWLSSSHPVLCVSSRSSEEN
jgi:hypothetical protein